MGLILREQIKSEKAKRAKLKLMIACVLKRRMSFLIDSALEMKAIDLTIKVKEKYVSSFPLSKL